MGQEMGGRFKREGIYVYLWLIHFEVSEEKKQNSIKQLSVNKKINLKNELLVFFFSWKISCQLYLLYASVGFISY